MVTANSSARPQSLTVGAKDGLDRNSRLLLFRPRPTGNSIFIKLTFQLFTHRAMHTVHTQSQTVTIAVC